ncbi:BglG family transcription antiterminator LicT [Clostridium hydrogenum]|uniref:BglG family transcription antiterminator LicT n=1 Tax=Clostridium hydrogenum TaxID=2855764 RepID=UPI001F46D516|nr:PRD domain-containing protein [Clostridium hydrogenum]
MIIKKILNNNVITTLDETTKLEKVVMGVGIAFQKKAGDVVNESKIDKVFVIENENENLKFQELVHEVPMEYVKVSEAIISFAARKLETKFDDHIYIALTDHLAFAIKRHQMGIEIKNNMLWDIQRIYKKEYNIGLWALEYIDRELGIKFKVDEAGFIAMHLIDASLKETMDNTISITEIVENILNLIKYFYSIEFNENDISYDRLLTHLKFFAQRVVSKKNMKDDGDEHFLKVVKESYKDAYKCVIKIKSYVEKNYDYNVNDGELVYLTLHIQRILSSLKHRES